MSNRTYPFAARLLNNGVANKRRIRIVFCSVRFSKPIFESDRPINTRAVLGRPSVERESFRYDVLGKRSFRTAHQCIMGRFTCRVRLVTGSLRPERMGVFVHGNETPRGHRMVPEAHAN